MLMTKGSHGYQKKNLRFMLLIKQLERTHNSNYFQTHCNLSPNHNWEERDADLADLWTKCEWEPLHLSMNGSPVCVSEPSPSQGAPLRSSHTEASVCWRSGKRQEEWEESDCFNVSVGYKYPRSIYWAIGLEWTLNTAISFSAGWGFLLPAFWHQSVCVWAHINRQVDWK